LKKIKSHVADFCPAVGFSHVLVRVQVVRIFRIGFFT